MGTRSRLIAVLLWAHLFVCVVYLLALSSGRHPLWMTLVSIFAVFSIQLTWGFTVGLIAGPGRRRRGLLKWSFLTLFVPLYVVQAVFLQLLQHLGLMDALAFVGIALALLAAETVGGIMLGAYVHGRDLD